MCIRDSPKSTREASVNKTSTRAISAIKSIIVDTGGSVTSMKPVTNHPIKIPEKMNIICALTGSLSILREITATIKNIKRKNNSSII